MGTHPIFESDFDCLTEETAETRESDAAEKLTPDAVYDDTMEFNSRKRSHTGEPRHSSDESFKIKKFGHQVAGRNPMFELSSHQILKPLNTREAEFYQRFPRSLKERKLTCH